MTTTTSKPPRYGETEVEPPSDEAERRLGQEGQDQRFWSVTTVIGTLDKPALLDWAAAQTAEYACDIAQTLPARMAEEGREEVVRQLKGARFRKKRGQRTATELGTAVHNACEFLAYEGHWPEVDDEVAPFVEQLDRLWSKVQPEWVAAETSVYSEEFGYAGTLDGIVLLEGSPYMLDFKSTRNTADRNGKANLLPYPEVSLQLAAYRYAEFLATWTARRYEKWSQRYYLLSPAERKRAMPMPPTVGGVVVHVTPRHASLVPVRCDEAVWGYYLSVVDVASWALEFSKSVIGAPWAVVGA